MKKLAFVLLAFITFNASAQDSCFVCKPHQWEIGVPIGVNQYFGDMHCSKPYASQNSLMAGLFVRKHITDYFALRPQVLIGRLAGRDIDNPIKKWDYRRLGFKSNGFVEAALLGEFYPLKDRKYTCNGFKSNLVPYLFGGIGATYSNPTVYQDAGATFPVNPRDLAADRAYTAASFAHKVAAVFPVGLGLKYNATQRFTLGAEAGYRFSSSDYLDGISQAGNSGKKDGYFLANVLGSYRFGDKDSDKDGVVNKCDLCPAEKGLARFQGCPDTDGDGTPDKDDECPTVAGPMGLKGCPDSDGDGVADKNDGCPTLVGTPSMNGCPDKDFDGIADKDDTCPTLAGVKELKGCPDTDGDGIADNVDACPNNAGSAALRGCPDADGDGIADSKDDCINIKGIASLNGCPEGYVKGSNALNNTSNMKGGQRGAMTTAPSSCKISASEIEQLNMAAQSIEFFPGTNKINPASFRSLQRVCDVLSRCPSSKLTINNYSDGGTDAQSVRLAKLRACAVYAYFMKKKCISKSRMNYSGYGDEDTKSNYMTPTGKKAGSRTEFILN